MLCAMNTLKGIVYAYMHSVYTVSKQGNVAISRLFSALQINAYFGFICAQQVISTCCADVRNVFNIYILSVMP